MKKKCIIVGAMPISIRLKKPREHFFVIAADGGLDNCLKAEIIPDLFIGDFDSINEIHIKIKKIRLPKKKDMTDLHAAVAEGLRLKYSIFYLVGCTGGRLDHYLSALALLESIHEKGGQGILKDDKNTVFFHPGGRMLFKRGDCEYISIIPLDRQLKGVYLRGMKYSLRDAEVKRGDSLTVSNEIIGGFAEIIIGKGRSLIIIN